MLDLETTNSKDFESDLFYSDDFVCDIENDLMEFVECEICLGNPITHSEDSRLLQMHSNERDYGKYLLKKGVILFPEPELIGLKQSPDFFVWKPNTQMWETPYSGFFYELTLFKKSEFLSNSGYARRKFARKRRQKEMFESLGLPVKYIFREEQDRIREFQTTSERIF